ncbi:MAG: heavy metal-binding domain-containing protein [Blastocatellales bacterium]
MKRRDFVLASSFGLATLAYGANAQNKKQYVCPPCGCSHDGEVHDEPGNCPACDMALVEKTAEMSELTAIPRFLKLNDQVWTAGQPTFEHLSKLKEEGVKTVINLRPHSEHNGNREAARLKELGINYFNIPVVYREPQPEDADDFLRITDEQLKNGPVFIHCAAAIRVGAFWMIRRVLRDGWEFDKALEEANKIGLRNQQHLIDFAKEYIEKNKKK